MDIEKLIERLRKHRAIYKTDYDEFSGGACTSDCVDAADALSALQDKNEKLRAELEQLKRERDAAIADMESLMWYGGDGCRICAHAIEIHREPYVRLGCDIDKGTDCCPKWRGPKKED